MPVRQKKSAQKSKRAQVKFSRTLRRFVIFGAIIALTWGIWSLFDHFFILPNKPLVGPVVAIAVALLLLFLDDFHLRELE